MKSPLKAHTKARTKKRRPSTVVRRSVALPKTLVEQVQEAAPEYGGNLNAIVKAALEHYVKKRDDEAFDRELEEMAADPQIQAVNAELNEEFKHTLLDGLPDDPTW